MTNERAEQLPVDLRVSIVVIFHLSLPLTRAGYANEEFLAAHSNGAFNTLIF